jgi:hypothetical protein
MNTRTRLTPFLALAVLALMASACTPKVATGPEQTFTVDVPRPETSDPTEVTLEIEVPQGTLALAGGAEGLIQGVITYNAAEYKPQVTTGDGTLLISQTAPRTVVVSVQNDVINRWDLRLSDAPMNLAIGLETGDHTVEFAESLPANLNVNVNASVGNLELIIAPGLAAQIILGEKSKPDVKTHGDWTQTGDMYETSSGSATLTITVNMTLGGLTLDSQ